jgi:hypothetical protein
MFHAMIALWKNYYDCHLILSVWCVNKLEPECVKYTNECVREREKIEGLEKIIILGCVCVCVCGIIISVEINIFLFQLLFARGNR